MQVQNTEPHSPPLKPRQIMLSNTESFTTPHKISPIQLISQSKTERFHNSNFAEHSSNEKRVYADRFIPLRPDSVSKNLFTLFQTEQANDSKESDFFNNKENNYNKLLENELLAIPDLKLKMKIIEEEEDSFKHPKSINPNYIQSSFKKHRKSYKSNHFTQKKVPHLLKFRSPQAQNQQYLTNKPQNISITPFNTFELMDLESQAKKPDYREISSRPIKTLDAPFLEDDFYLNLIDWSSQNLLSVILGHSLFLYNHETAAVSKFITKPQPPYFTSSSFDPTGSYIALGDTEGKFELFDINKSACLFAANPHDSRITTIAWNNPYLLATGSKDHSIKILDLRQNQPIISTFLDHKQEVCGLKWSNDGLNLASGGNDNKVLIWNLKKHIPELRYEGHRAAIKALAWAPMNRGVLMTGGGTYDTTIKVWNTLSNTIVRETVTNSQVCGLMFSKTTNEFVSTHGFEKNEIIVWDFETFEKRKVLRGHNARVLFLAMSGNGRYIATGAGTGDETVKLWDVFPEIKEEKSEFFFPFNDLR